MFIRNTSLYGAIFLLYVVTYTEVLVSLYQLLLTSCGNICSLIACLYIMLYAVTHGSSFPLQYSLSPSQTIRRESKPSWRERERVVSNMELELTVNWNSVSDTSILRQHENSILRWTSFESIWGPIHGSNWN